MAGSDSSMLPIAIEVLRKLKTLGFCLDLEEEEEEEESNTKKPISLLFNRIISSFIKQTQAQTHDRHHCKRPIPPLLGDGKSVDLFALYYAVAVRNGGYDSVTANGSWDSVAESIGCHSGDGSSVKLIFFKYFDELCRCLGTKGSSFDASKLKPLLGLEESSGNEPLLGLEESSGNGDVDGDVVVLDPVDAGQDFLLLKTKTKRKRKWEPLVGMLDWLLLVAKNPCDRSIGMITWDDRREEREFEVGLMFSQALTARHAMFHEPKRGSDKIHPLINGDSNGVCAEKLKHGESIESLKSPLQSCAHSALSNMPEDGGDHKHDKKRQRSLNSSEYMLLASLPVPPKIDWVRVGTSYQAEVPACTLTASVASDYPHDSKWLGTKIWPPEKKENRSLIERDPICKGRNENCGCQSPGSIECVRFHVREKRNRLKLELGSVFYSWEFDHMGEEVALSWTEEEERKFKAVIRLNRRCVRKNIWSHLFLTFPDKGRKKVLSYYFNVFLLRERSYQNRVTPENIDSD